MLRLKLNPVSKRDHCCFTIKRNRGRHTHTDVHLTTDSLSPNHTHIHGALLHDVGIRNVGNPNGDGNEYDEDSVGETGPRYQYP